MADQTEINFRLQIGLIYEMAKSDAIVEVLRKVLPQVHGQSLDCWLDQRVGELVYQSLTRIEDVDPANAAILQAEITKAEMRLKRKQASDGTSQ